MYLTRTFHALALDFQLEVYDDTLGEYFDWVFASFAPASGEVTTFVTRVRADAEGIELVEARPDTEDVVEVLAADTGELVMNTVHWLNRRAIDAEYAVMCHAGGVARNGVAYVLPAEMESGKTTLTTGLVQRGFDYLTDEAVAFDPVTGVIDPYPKPLSIDAGSQFLFPHLAPPPTPGCDAPPAEQWQVPNSLVRADSTGAPCRAGYVIFPRYEKGIDTVITPLKRSEALVELAKNTFAFRDHARRSLATLANVIGGAECFKLSVGDLSDACALIDALPLRAEATTSG